MIRQSGAKTSAQVAEFCLATGIPLSRMLKLDLMRQCQGGGQSQSPHT
jgi:hypothetical protein